MTGAKNLFPADNGNALVFQLPRGAGVKDGINVVRISLDPSDTYTVRFSKQATARGGYKMATIREISGVYADQLRDIFESVTGLATSLGTMGRSGRSGDLRRVASRRRASRASRRGSRR